MGVDAQQPQPVDGRGLLERARRLRPSRSRTSSRPGRWRSSRACRRPRPGSPARAPAAAPGAPSRAGSSQRAGRDQLPQPLELVEVVDHDRPEAMARGPCAAPRATWRCRAAPGARRGKPALSARCSSPPEATSHHRPSCANSSSTALQGNALEANTTSQLVVAGLPGGRQEGPRPGAQVLLGDHVGGRPELACQLDQVAAADLQAAVLVDAAAQGKDLGYGRAAGHRRADYRFSWAVSTSARMTSMAARPLQLRSRHRTSGPDAADDVPARARSTWCSSACCSPSAPERA